MIKWTEELIQKLQDYINLDMHRGDIMKEMNLSYKQIDNAVTRFGLKATPISDEILSDVSELREMGKNWDVISSEIDEMYGIKYNTTRLKCAFDAYCRKNDERVDTVGLLKSKRLFQKTNSTLRRDAYKLLDLSNEIDQSNSKLQGIAQNIAESIVAKYDLPKKSKSYTDRAVVAMISDTHFGITIDSKEVGGGNVYNPEIAAERLGTFAEHMISYKLDHRKESEAVIVLAGDLLQGIIHPNNNTDLMIHQFAMTLSYMTQFIAIVAKNFKKVTVYHQTGNHSRFMHKANKGRQTDEKYDSYETMVAVALQQAFAKSNVSIVITKAPYTIADICGNKAFITHGDTVIGVGNVGKKIDTSGIIAKLNNFNLELMKNGQNVIDMLLTGHVHIAAHVVTESGTHIVVNSSMSGLDPFANQLGIASSNPTSMLFESSLQHPVGDVRIVSLKYAQSDLIVPYHNEDIFGG